MPRLCLGSSSGSIGAVFTTDCTVDDQGTEQLNPSADGKPSGESLAVEKTVPGWEAAIEWKPMTPDELDTVQRLRGWLGAARLAVVPADLLVCFVRGYSYRKDWAEASCAFLDRCLDWRAEICADTLPQRPPANSKIWSHLQMRVRLKMLNGHIGNYGVSESFRMTVFPLVVKFLPGSVIVWCLQMCQQYLSK